ncbi:MAG: UDP-N-acetylmuramate dehydrogenase [candidate division Zixibacteria bacterium]|nr:UDP-N-acetylmuramate dehydrogenase [candidate division Zixibacteria bacterium]
MSHKDKSDMTPEMLKDNAAKPAWEPAFKKRFEGLYLENEPMSKHTSIRIGGPARFLVNAASVDDLIDAVKFASQNGIDYFLLGGGSNILVGDYGFHGIVIKNMCVNYIIDDNIISAETGMTLDDLVDVSHHNSLSGLEFAAGIWGTVGGAVCGNAGAFGGSVSDVFHKAVLLDEDNKVVTADKEKLKFRYRHSALKDNRELALSASFKLVKGDKDEIGAKISRHREIRREKHPLDYYSAGSFFKNLKNPRDAGMNVAAGWYLDQVGARERRIGDAGVFEKHANIFVNYGEATAADMVKLGAGLKAEVKEKFSVDLRMEVRPVGDFGEHRELLETIID